MSLEAVRDAIDSCGETDAAAFARRTRNEIACAILEEALAHRETSDPAHAAPLGALRRSVGDDLGDLLAAVYAGGEDWTSYAIDALQPLNELTRARTGRPGRASH